MADISDVEYSNEETVMGLLSDLDAKSPDATVLRMYKNGELYEYTAHGLYKDVCAIGTAFVSMGLTGKTIAIVGKNSYYWLVSYLAGVCAGAAVLTVDTGLSPTVLSQQLKLANTELALCDGECFGKISDRAYNTAVLLDKSSAFISQSNIEDLLETGFGLAADGYKEFAHVCMQRSSVSHIVFESGVYGREKAVVLSGRSLYTQIVNAADMVGASNVLITEQFSSNRSLICGIATIALGNTLCMSADKLPVYDAAYVTEPELILCSPLNARLYYTDIWAMAKDAGIAAELENKIKSSMRIANVLSFVRKANAAFLHKKDIPTVKRIVTFGNNMDSEIAFGLHILGIDVTCCYEVPECGIISFTTRSDGKNETLGRPVKDAYIKINKFGQLMVKSDACMSGYLGEGMYPDHWIPTGDSGTFENSEIVLTNNSGSVFITESANRVFPMRLAEIVKKQIPYARTVNVNAGTDGISIALSFDSDFIKITGKKEIERIVNMSVDGMNRTLGEYEQITDIVIDDIA